MDSAFEQPLAHGLERRPAGHSTLGRDVGQEIGLLREVDGDQGIDGLGQTKIESRLLLVEPRVHLGEEVPRETLAADDDQRMPTQLSDLDRDVLQQLQITSATFDQHQLVVADVGRLVDDGLGDLLGIDRRGRRFRRAEARGCPVPTDGGVWFRVLIGQGLQTAATTGAKYDSSHGQEYSRQ